LYAYLIPLPLVTPRHIWDDNIRMDRRKIGWEGVECIWLRIATRGGTLWTRYWTFGNHEIWGISWLAPQERLYSMEFISHLPHTCYIPISSHSPRFDRPNNMWWSVQVMEAVWFAWKQVMLLVFLWVIVGCVALFVTHPVLSHTSSIVSRGLLRFPRSSSLTSFPINTSHNYRHHCSWPWWKRIFFFCGLECDWLMRYACKQTGVDLQELWSIANHSRKEGRFRKFGQDQTEVIGWLLQVCIHTAQNGCSVVCTRTQWHVSHVTSSRTL
jgi:hypothetical protein